MVYLEFNDGDYTKLRKSLIKKEGSHMQKEFLRAVKDNITFLAYMDTCVAIEDLQGNKKFDLISDQLTEAEFKEPPKMVEKVLCDLWQDLTPAQASRETFWGYVTLEHIRSGVIDASFLAANGGSLPGGLARIDKVLNTNEEKSIDDAVRTVLRRLGGLPEARGPRSVYVNCPFARVWWQGWIANEVCEHPSADLEKVKKTLAQTQTYWEKLIQMIVSRNSVLGDTKIRTALIWALSESIDDEEKQSLYMIKTLERIIRQIGIRCAWQELGVFSIDELKTIIEENF